jgi:pimeloyl-ACP methyl ester carboxylesterase
VKEFPFFVPYEDQFLAGTLTVPDRDPEALVLLLAGTGAPRSHRFQLWTRTARGLAEHGLASVRLDYRGIGDSSGRVLQPVLGDQRTEQAITAARFCMQACSVERVAVIGNCSGGVVGLGVTAQMPEVETAILILPRLVQMSTVGRKALDARKSRLGAIVRRHRLLRRVAHTTMKTGRDVASPPVAASFEPALDHARLLFVYSEHDRDPYVGKSRRLLQQMIAKLPSERRSRVDSMLIDEGPLSGFESRAVQERVIAEVVQWTADGLGVNGHGARGVEASQVLGAGATRPK